MVFDGANLPAKQKTEIHRGVIRTEALKAGLKCFNSKDPKEHADARTHFSRSVDVTPYMAGVLIKILKRTRPEVGC